MRLRVAEICERAVAHDVGDESAKVVDRLVHAAVKGPDHLANILGIVLCRQRGRADQIVEHHRELPPLGLMRYSCSPFSAG